MPSERLQKIIAAAGIASRRKSEELITSGRVQVNGQVVTELGSKADPEQDHIRVDGKLLQGPERFTYVALNKPKGYVTTVSDEKKRPTVMDLVQKVKGRVYPVGRLDWASEGLMLMTNDGALANALMKASSNVPKTYVVKVAGQPDEGKLDKLRRGVSIAEKGGRRVRTAPARIRLIREGDNPWLEVTIIEGRNRQVRKMFEEVGHHVEKIRRVQYGPLALDVPPGDWRNLTLLEVAKLKSAATGPKLTLAPDVPAPARVLKAPISKLARVPKPLGRSRSPMPSRSRNRGLCHARRDRHARRNLRLGNAHPDRRNRRHHDRPRRDPRRRNHPSFRMASLHPASFRARRELPLPSPRAYRSANATSVLLPQAWAAGPRRTVRHRSPTSPCDDGLVAGPGLRARKRPVCFLEDRCGAVAAYTRERCRNSSKIAGEKASHALETPPPIT
jgi:23S rRNA pseudouridine2605 synthase